MEVKGDKMMNEHRTGTENQQDDFFRRPGVALLAAARRCRPRTATIVLNSPSDCCTSSAQIWTSRGGSTANTNDDWGLSILGGYNINEHLATTFGMQWTGVGYDATPIDEDGRPIAARGSYDTWAFTGNLVYNILEGPITPDVSAGIGWMF